MVCFPPQLFWFKVRWFSSVLIVIFHLLILSNKDKANLTSCWGELQPGLFMGSSSLPCLAFQVFFISTTFQFHNPILQNSLFWVTLVRFSTYFASAYHVSCLLPCCLIACFLLSFPPPILLFHRGYFFARKCGTEFVWETFWRDLKRILVKHHIWKISLLKPISPIYLWHTINFYTSN